MQPIQGLHHITAVASDPQKNFDFYHYFLGQRLVKTTVNFDDPGTYHLYYGDEIGTPGTALTFFPWQHRSRGRLGNGETAAIAYSIPSNSFGFWHDYLKYNQVNVEQVERFDAPGLAFNDPDGIKIEFIANDGLSSIRFWKEGPIPEEHILRGFHGVTLWLAEIEPTANLLTKQLGYNYVGQENNRYRYQAASQNIGLYIDLLHQPGTDPGSFGVGSIHHIAFRTVDDSEQLDYRNKLLNSGQRVTSVHDRKYFRSIYFRSPGGVLFEIATDAPGFLYDENREELGSRLKLPAWYEPKRSEIEQFLPSIKRKPVTKAEHDYA